MIIKPTVTDLLKIVDNRYELVIMTAKRARQISLGSPRLANTKVESDVTAAAIEIDEGKDKISDDENTEE